MQEADPGRTLEQLDRQMRVEPLPGDPKLIESGLALASAISVFSESMPERGLAARTTGTRPTRAMGVMRSRAYGAGWNSETLAASAFAASISVVPSGGLSISVLVAMFVPAPGLLSTITGWPSPVCRCWPIARAMMSTAPPAL